MFSHRCIVCREVKIKNWQSYVIYMCVEESNQEEISLFLTDCETFLLGCIKTEEIANITSELGIGEDSIKSIGELLRTSVKQNRFEYNDDECKLIFILSKGQTLTVDLKTTTVEDKTKHLKFLLFQLAKQVSCLEEGTPTKGMPPGGEDLVALRQLRTSKAISPRRRAAGMSIVNPRSKRIRTSPGVHFDEG